MTRTPIVYKARFKVEANTALRIGSGKEGLLVDGLVAKDANGLPYIPGTSLAGVLRHEIERYADYKQEVGQLFGFQEEEVKQGEQYPRGQGSRIIFSDAQLLAYDEKKQQAIVHEGLQEIDFEAPFYQSIQQLPERDHVRINHKGVAQDTGKYLEELVRRGTRFVFELELHGTAQDEAVWNHLLEIIHHDSFRVGAGTRKGFGQLSVVSYDERKFDLKKDTDLTAYLAISSSLAETPDGVFPQWKPYHSKDLISDRYQHYQLKLTPQDFFLFGAGIGDGDIDALPKTEKYIQWEGDVPSLTEEQLLIPATSIKGAIAHRVAYHYNLLTDWRIEKLGNISAEDAGLSLNVAEIAGQSGIGVTFERLEGITASDPIWERWKADIEALDYRKTKAWQVFKEAVRIKKNTISSALIGVGEQNLAVRTFFGFAKEKRKDDKQKNKQTDETDGARGLVIFSDTYKAYQTDKHTKLFNHVAIDRFKGGSRNGALFQERVATTNEIVLNMSIDLESLKAMVHEEENEPKPKHKISQAEYENILQAWQDTLEDLANARLALGGHTTKGHGLFKGTITTNPKKEEDAK
ncbi:MAG: RAMP superfamily CRISPR-associated protein [Bacteroidota bacterium]